MKKSIKFTIGALALITFTTIIPITIIQTISNSNNIISSDDDLKTSNPNNPDTTISTNYPNFLEKITSANEENVNGKTLIENLDEYILTNNNIAISYDLIRRNLDTLLVNHINKYSYMYLLNDIKQYMYDLYISNNNLFAIIDSVEPTINIRSENKLDVDIYANFTVYNKSNKAQKLLDNEGQIIEELGPLEPKESLKIEISNSVEPTLNNKSIHASLNTNNEALYLNWYVPKLTISFQKEERQILEKNYDNFSFNKKTSHINVSLNSVKLAKDPYTAQKDIVGKNRLFNTELINKNQIQDDISYLFETNLALAKNIATSVSEIFGTFVNFHNSNQNYLIADVITKNAKNISETLASIFPEFATKKENSTSIQEFVFDLLTNYSKLEIHSSNFYDLIYKHKNLLVEILQLALSDITLDTNDIVDLFSGVNSGEELFKMIASLASQANLILTGSEYKPLLELIDALIKTNEIYLFDFLSDKQNATNLVDSIINLGLKSYIQQNSKLEQFINQFKTLFIDLLSTANDPIDEILTILFADQVDENQNIIKKGNFINLLNIFGIDLNSLLKSSEIYQLFDLFFLSNDSLSTNDKTITKNVYIFLDEISKFLSKSNLDKITIKPINSLSKDNSLSVEYSEDGNDLLVKNLDANYQINVDNLVIPNSLINSILNFLPTEFIGTTLERFINDDIMSVIREQTYIQTKAYMEEHYSWASFIINIETTSKNIAYGKNGNDGIVDTIIENIKTQSPENASIKTLLQETFFGTYEFEPSNPWLTLNGTIDIKYSGNDLYVLPTYTYDLFNNLKMNYQILNAQTLIDANNLGTNSNFGNQTLPTNITHIIPSYDISKQLHTTFMNFAKNFVTDMASRSYLMQTNLYLNPKTNQEKFVLDPNIPSQNIDPNLYVENYTSDRSDALNATNYQTTKQSILNANWTWNEQTPTITEEAQNLINGFVTFDDKFLSEQAKYITMNTSKFGIRNTSFDLSVKESVYIGHFLLKNITVTIKLNFSFEIRVISHNVTLPYPIFDKATNKLTSSITIDLSNLESSFTYGM